MLRAVLALGLSWPAALMTLSRHCCRELDNIQAPPDDDRAESSPASCLLDVEPAGSRSGIIEMAGGGEGEVRKVVILSMKNEPQPGYRDICSDDPGPTVSDLSSPISSL